MKIGLVPFVAIAGICNAVQSGGKATLDKTLDRPLWAVGTVFSVALAIAPVIALASDPPLPSAADFRRLPGRAGVGGVFGAVYILLMVLAADKPGAAVPMGLTVTMAVVISLALDHVGLIVDHFGRMGFDRRPAGPRRSAGGVPMVAGLALIARF